jgi:hypothetical protein
MLWQSGSADAPGAGPGRDPGAPGASAAHERHPSLATFAAQDGCDALVPSALLALAAQAAGGPGWRCPGATADELVGLTRAFAAIESWASAGKHGTIAELVRRDDAPRPAGGRHGDLPDTWSPSLRHQLALALACSVQSAETTTWIAWELRARLPGIGALLEDGTLTPPKARAVAETFKYLTDADAATAESLILGQLKDKTYPQVLRLAEQAALTVDPELAERRRLQAQKTARVTCFREQSGTAGLSGRDLPPDEALAAMAAVNARAQEYEGSGAFGATPRDALRAYAYLDLLTGTPAGDRISCTVAQGESDEIAEALAWANTRAARAAAQTQNRPDAATEAEPGTAPRARAGAEDGTGTKDTPTSGQQPGGNTADRDDDDDNRGDDGDEPGEDRGDGSGPGGPEGPGGGDPDPAPGTSPAGRAVRPRLPDLVVPLLTLLGRAERPGETRGFGLLDPALARSLAAAATVSPLTEVCVTVTSAEGYAIGHGCARPERPSRPAWQPSAHGASGTGLPAWLNLTIPAEALASLVCRACEADGSDSTGSWSFVPRVGTGPPGGTNPPVGMDPPDGYGTWRLTLPGGRRLTVRLEYVPTENCDHQYASPGYHPSTRLRHLVQVRDGTCTFPTCNRHARDSDFEHAIPFEKGGRTCACNAGARSRACHRVKQTKGWAVRQLRPGWHQWSTPTGRVYIQEPKRYPA